MTSTREERNRRRPWIAAFVFGMGVLFLVIGLNRPGIANMRTLDLVHLLATGAYFGIALVTVAWYVVDRRKG